MRTINAYLAAVACALAPLCLTLKAAPAAGEVNLTQPVICAATEATQCQETATCVQGPAGLFNLPVIFRINFQDKIAESIREGGERRSSPIDRVEKKGDAVILQGADDNAAWIATIHATNGNMTVATVREGQAFVVFGSCVRP